MTALQVSEYIVYKIHVSTFCVTALLVVGFLFLCVGKNHAISHIKAKACLQVGT